MTSTVAFYIQCKIPIVQQQRRVSETPEHKYNTRNPASFPDSETTLTQARPIMSYISLVLHLWCACLYLAVSVTMLFVQRTYYTTKYRNEGEITLLVLYRKYPGIINFLHFIRYSVVSR